MRLLKIHLFSLLFAYGIFFNIERLDFGIENVLNIQTFVYVLVLLVTTIILILPVFSQYRVTLAIGFALGLYLLGKIVFFMDRPFFGGIYTYVSITEMAFLAIIAFISQRLSQSLNEFQQGLEAMTMSLGGGHLQTISKASGDIRREITRSRHYHRPLSIIVVEPNQQSFYLALPRIFEELQKETINRYARIKLARTMHQHLRLMDLVLEEDDSNRFVILCPEADDQGSAVIVERIQRVMNQTGIVTKCSTATFPEDALTFDGLLNQAREKLNVMDEPDNETLHEPDIQMVL